jgi:hypothetical protein
MTEPWYGNNGPYCDLNWHQLATDFDNAAYCVRSFSHAQKKKYLKEEFTSTAASFD